MSCALSITKSGESRIRRDVGDVGLSCRPSLSSWTSSKAVLVRCGPDFGGQVTTSMGVIARSETTFSDETLVDQREQYLHREILRPRRSWKSVSGPNVNHYDLGRCGTASGTDAASAK